MLNYAYINFLQLIAIWDDLVVSDTHSCIILITNISAATQSAQNKHLSGLVKN